MPECQLIKTQVRWTIANDMGNSRFELPSLFGIAGTEEIQQWSKKTAGQGELHLVGEFTKNDRCVVATKTKSIAHYRS